MSDIDESLSAGESEDEQQTGAIKLNLQEDAESDFDEDDDDEEDEGAIKPPITLGKTLPSTSITSDTLPETIIPKLEQQDVVLDPDEDVSELSDDDDDDDDEDEDYLQKFDSDLKDNYLVNFHPESQAINYNEIAALSRVVRDEDGIIVDTLHQTIPWLDKFEKTRILGQRAVQLNKGATPFVKVPSNIIDGYLIAQMELEQKKIPYILRRPLPGGGSEYWKLQDLELIDVN